MAGMTGMVTVPPDPPCLAMVFSKHICTACHTGAAPAGGGLDLTGSNLGQRMVTTQAKYRVTSNAAACKAGALIIDPVNKDESVMLRKVRGTQTCGDKMPLGTGLMGADLQCIENWIMGFAAANVIESPDGFDSADTDAPHP